MTKGRAAASLALLIAGTLPYVLWRHDAIFLRPLRPWLPAAPPLPPSALTAWLLYSFPDGAWYAAMLVAAGAYTCHTAAERAVRAAILALPFVLEALQAAGIIAGTADMADILTYTTILILYLTMRKLKLSKSLAAQAAVLVAFAAVAMASGSSSNKSYQESYEDGYRLGQAIRQAVSETTVPADTLQIIPGAELADNR
ncbi:MAG: hypothetical protein NC406_09815 [Bacteroides sp.]|nr:hypothetical protein [Bacteroides sp.]MCM1096163.1 hypothetical protein [Terasakiella sp.]